MSRLTRVETLIVQHLDLEAHWTFPCYVARFGERYSPIGEYPQPTTSPTMRRSSGRLRH